MSEEKPLPSAVEDPNAPLVVSEFTLLEPGDVVFVVVDSKLGLVTSTVTSGALRGSPAGGGQGVKR